MLCAHSQQRQGLLVANLIRPVQAQERGLCHVLRQPSHKGCRAESLRCCPPAKTSTTEKEVTKRICHCGNTHHIQQRGIQPHTPGTAHASCLPGAHPARSWSRRRQHAHSALLSFPSWWADGEGVGTEASEASTTSNRKCPEQRSGRGSAQAGPRVREEEGRASTPLPSGRRSKGAAPESVPSPTLQHPRAPERDLPGHPDVTRLCAWLHLGSQSPSGKPGRGQSSAGHGNGPSRRNTAQRRRSSRPPPAAF